VVTRLLIASKRREKKTKRLDLFMKLIFLGKTNDKWCLDSGCTSHICNDKELFIDSQCQLKLASNATTQAIAKGISFSNWLPQGIGISITSQCCGF
jgi:hypothetical protein